MKKTDVYVVIDTPKKARKLKRLFDMFEEKHFADVYRLNFEDCVGHAIHFWENRHFARTGFKNVENDKSKVSIKELRNILAKEHLKKGDVCLFDDRKGFRSIGVFDKYSEEYTDFLVSKVPGKDSVRYGFHDFIRYATEEEKALLEPKKELEIGKWYVFSWDDDPNNVRGVYLIDKINNDEVWFKYGVNIAGNYWSEPDWGSKTHNWRLASPQEVEQALVEEAKRRYKVGNVIKCLDGVESELEGNSFVFSNNCLFSNGKRVSGGDWFNTYGKVFENGQWADVIKQPKRSEDASNFTDSDVAIVERLHDTLLDNHGYSLQSELLIDARLLANKIKSKIK